MSKKTPARLRELSTDLGTISRNLADVFLDIPVFHTPTDWEPLSAKYALLLPHCSRNAGQSVLPSGMAERKKEFGWKWMAVVNWGGILRAVNHSRNFTTVASAIAARRWWRMALATSSCSCHFFNLLKTFLNRAPYVALSVRFGRYTPTSGGFLWRYDFVIEIKVNELLDELWTFVSLAWVTTKAC